MTRTANATVTQASPPKIVMDGGMTAIPAQTLVAVTVGQHVQVTVQGRGLRPIITGPIK